MAPIKELIPGVFFFFSLACFGAEVLEAKKKGAELVKANVITVLPDLPIERVVESVVKGVYQIQIEGGAILHASEDGRYLIAGDIFEMDINQAELINLADQHRRVFRQTKIKNLDSREFINFGNLSTTTAIVTVFTDVDCEVCRELHSRLSEYHDIGIVIRYLAYPRAGPGSSSFEKMVSAWCAADPQTALNKLLSGEDIPVDTCENPVETHFDLAGVFGAKGTPVIVLPDGQMLYGIIAADEMLAKIKGLEN